jgi:hypothetical protein
MNSTRREVIAVALRYLGRALALLLVLFWGAFFLEHLTEWFLRPRGALPPAWVWISQLLHLAMLVGLAQMLWWDRLGSIVTALATTAFFAIIGIHGFPFIALINLLPIACFAASWCLHPPRTGPARPVPYGASQ